MSKTQKAMRKNLIMFSIGKRNFLMKDMSSEVHHQRTERRSEKLRVAAVCVSSFFNPHPLQKVTATKNFSKPSENIKNTFRPFFIVFEQSTNRIFEGEERSKAYNFQSFRPGAPSRRYYCLFLDREASSSSQWRFFFADFGSGQDFFT